MDPALFYLFELGFLDARRHGCADVASRIVRLSCHKALRRLRGLPSSETGHPHCRQSLAEIAARHGLRADFVTSMFYEYRYHAIFTRKAPGAER